MVNGRLINIDLTFFLDSILCLVVVVIPSIAGELWGVIVDYLKLSCCQTEGVRKKNLTFK